MKLPRPNSRDSDNLLHGISSLADAVERVFNSTDTATGFLSLAVPGVERSIVFGSTTVTWAGGTPVGGSSTVTHGLGTTPAAVVAISTTAGGFAIATYLPGAPGATTFTVNGYAQGGNPANGSTATVYWVAVG